MWESGPLQVIGPAPPPASEQTVLIDTTSSALSTGFLLGSGGVASDVFGTVSPLNVGSGSNGTSNMTLLAVLCFCGAAAGTSSFSGGQGLTWDFGGTNQLMTILGHIGNGNAGDVYLMGLRNPTNGAKTVKAVWTASNQAMVAFASFVNCDVTSDANAFPATQLFTNTGSSASATVNNAVTPTTRKIFSGFGSAGNFTSGSAGDLGADIGHNNTGNLGSGGALWAFGDSASDSYGTSSAAWAAISQAIKGH